VAAPAADARLQSVREHLRRYRELASQGHWAEAGKELEGIEAEVKR
jgi:septation ring formation regulator EzrA